VGYLEHVLGVFKFTRDTDLVAAACLVLLLSSFVGGMLAKMFQAMGGPKKPVSFTSTNGFRILILFEICLVAVAFFYHMSVIGRIGGTHVVFWVASLLAMPVTWFIGSALMHLVFFAKIAKNEKAYRDMLAQKKYAKHKKMREQIREDTKDSRQAMSERASISAKGKRGHQATVKRRRPEEF
tara:strand:- start:194 stop:739 length:546 start_codon:yes stop_codon:yes gene_type:complete